MRRGHGCPLSCYHTAATMLQVPIFYFFVAGKKLQPHNTSENTREIKCPKNVSRKYYSTYEVRARFEKPGFNAGQTHRKATTVVKGVLSKREFASVCLLYQHEK